MNMEDKIKSFKPQLKFNTTAKRHRHLYADYVELITLFENGNYVTLSYILDRLRDEGVNIKEEADEKRAGENDRQESSGRQIFQLLETRHTFLLNDYPFKINDGNSMSLITDPLSSKQKLYIYLLLSANLSNFKDFQSLLTSDFEKLCYYMLKDYLPNFAEVKQLGKNSDYIGNAFQKLEQLSKDIKIKTNEESFNSTNIAGNQERGLDVIGWLPFKDDFPNKTIFTCQCACGDEWYKKTNETKRFDKYWKLECKLIHTMFIPYSLMSNNETFYQNDEIPNSLLFERGRILEQIRQFDFLDSFDSMKLVNKCLEVEEDIV
jgi:hypothetical protein